MRENPEDVLLGICLCDQDAFTASVDAGLRSCHFADTVNRKLFDCLLECEAKSEKIDWDVLAARNPDLEPRIRMLIDDPHLGQNPIAHAIAIQNEAHLRLVKDELFAAHKVALDSNPYHPLDELARYLKRVGDLVYGSAGENLGGKTSFDLAVRYLSEVDDRIMDFRKGTSKRITTGIRSLDQAMNGGWRKKAMYVVAAGSGIGKTSFAINSMLAAARSGKRCLYYTVEMDGLELMDKMNANEARVDFRSIDRGDLQDHEITAIKAATERVGKYHIKIDDEFNGDFGRLKLSVSKNMRVFKPEIIFIDYIGQLAMEGWKGEAKTQMLSRISHETKQMAMKHDVPIVALAQINREGDQSTTGPELWHLKDCGSFAHDCSMAVLIHSDEKEKRTVLKLRKTRHTQACDLIVRRELQFSRFGD